MEVSRKSERWKEKDWLESNSRRAPTVRMSTGGFLRVGVDKEAIRKIRGK